MTLPLRRAPFLLAALLFPGLVLSVPGQDANPNLATAHSQAMAEFQAGNYAKAANDLEALVARVEVSPQVEPTFYTLGSAWFNAGDYAKAIIAFKNYQIKFPKGPHAGSAAFAIAQSNLLSKNFKEAARQMAVLENDPQLREQALLFEAEAFKAANKTDDAIGALEKLAGKEITTSDAMRGATMLAQLYAEKGDGAKALRLLELIHQHIALAENIIELNSVTVELGDQFYNKQQFKEALACYRAAWPREKIIDLQKHGIAKLQAKIEENLAATRANPGQITQLAPANNRIKESIANAQKLLAEFEKLPSITPAIYLRLGRCFYELDRKWEAVVVYQEILDRFKDPPEREPALFGLIVALADINQPQRSEERCEQYLRDFKNGPNAATVGYLLGAVALQAGDPGAAETYLGRILENQPKSQFREQIRYLLANAKFMAANYDEAVAACKKYLAEFPKGPNAEDVNYRIALCALFAGKYQEAMNQLQDYVAKHPSGSFLPDAKYRLAVCKYAASVYDEVIADCQAWEREFPSNPQLGEVLALLGDAYAASDREAAAIPVYIRSYQMATTDEVMNYSLFAASKLLQKKGEWNKVGELFSGFIKEKPDNSTVVSAIFWIGKAKTHDGKIDEAKQLAADTIKKYITDPSRDSVEQLITQLAQLCVRKKPVVAGDVEPGSPSAAKTRPGSSSPATDPALPHAKAWTLNTIAELERLLASPANKDSATARARILFAKAELARLRRQPEEEERNIAQIAEAFKPEDLSPLLLGEAGDYVLSKDKFDQATRFYQRLRDDFPKSQMVDFAYHGLGEIAYQKKDYRKALREFSDGTEKIAAGQKLKDISVGRAKTLLALGKLDEAQKGFEQVASVRAWRGEATAFSVYSLGQIAARRGKWAEANAYFQRVYVGYQKFLPWVAKAYIASGESFEKLGKNQEAANTYRELLRNEKLANFAETTEARKRLQALGQG
ncbi:MAG TPA: tetratricopeptide repeat protein [Chthoniobacterales bacterium]|nr:tetratricopeptide repeat protein [Chthoniobacterales bacterium]